MASAVTLWRPSAWNRSRSPRVRPGPAMRTMVWRPPRPVRTSFTLPAQTLYMPVQGVPSWKITSPFW